MTPNNTPSPSLVERVAARTCQCDMRTKLTGDGCDVCNPKLAAELAEPARAEQPVASRKIDDLRSQGFEPYAASVMRRGNEYAVVGELGDVRWVRAEQPQEAVAHPGDKLRDAPLGTKAVAIGGGYWTKVEHGWRWGENGGRFPRPGADWTGELIAPPAVAEPDRIAMPSNRAALRVKFLYQAGYDPFVCGVDGHATVSALKTMEADCLENAEDMFPNGNGLYLFEASWFSGQYSEFGQCECAPGWELSLIAFEPVAAAKEGGSHE